TLVVQKIRGERAPHIAGLVPGLPPAVADMVHQALERDPERRFPTMQAFLREALDYAATIDPAFAARHARSIPRHGSAGAQGPTRGELASDSAEVSVDEEQKAPITRVYPSVPPVVRPDLEWHEDQPPAPVRGLDAYAEQALSVNALDDAIALAEQAIV